METGSTQVKVDIVGNHRKRDKIKRGKEVFEKQ